VCGKVGGGGREIRTHEGYKPLPVFKTGAFNRSASPPDDLLLWTCCEFSKGAHFELRDARCPEKTAKSYTRTQSAQLLGVS
jgi:hypothetical protein